ncbi:MAG: hypothetical protein OXC62_15380 [Aestuariivita sp.]|nr:hypothetical protein [Aestuariivita sp.]
MNVVFFTGLMVIVGVSMTACDQELRMETAAGLRDGQRLSAAQYDLLRSQLNGEVHREERPFYGAAVAVERGDVSGEPLPDAVEGVRGITLRMPGQSTVTTIAAAVTDATDIPINIRTRYVVGGGADSRVIDVPIGTRMRVNYEGSLSAFLDRLAARMDVGWSYDGTIITIDRMIRSTWRVSLPLGATRFTRSTDGESGHTLSTELTLDPWSDLEQRLAPLAPPPARITLSPDTGRVDAFGPPSVHAAIRAVLDDVATTAKTRIGLDVAVYFVDSDKADEFGVSTALDGLRVGEFAGRDVTADIAFRSSVGGLSSFLAGQAGGGIVLSRGNSFFSFEALARNSAVVDYRLASSVAQSGVITPIGLTEERSYIRSVTRERADDDNPGTVTYEIGEMETGLTLAALPRLVDHRQIHLSLTFSQRAFRGFDPDVLTRTGTIQAPTIDNRQITNETVLSPGETLVLAGYEQDIAEQGDSGAGFFRRIGLGGKTEAKRRKVRMVLMVRPTLIASRRDNT